MGCSKYGGTLYKLSTPILHRFKLCWSRSIAAGLVLFALMQKVPKKSRQKKASARRPYTMARFSVGPLRAFIWGL